MYATINGKIRRVTKENGDFFITKCNKTREKITSDIKLVKKPTRKTHEEKQTKCKSVEIQIERDALKMKMKEYQDQGRISSDAANEILRLKAALANLKSTTRDEYIKTIEHLNYELHFKDGVIEKLDNYLKDAQAKLELLSNSKVKSSKGKIQIQIQQQDQEKQGNDQSMSDLIAENKRLKHELNLCTEFQFQTPGKLTSPVEIFNTPTESQEVIDAVRKTQSIVISSLRDQVKTLKQQLQDCIEYNAFQTPLSPLSKMQQDTDSGASFYTPMQRADLDVLKQTQATVITNLRLKVKSLKQQLEDCLEYKSFRSPSQVYDTPSQVYDTPSQVYDTPSQVYDTPSQVYDTPSQVYDTPSQVYDTPSQVYDTPAQARELDLLQQNQARVIKNLRLKVKSLKQQLDDCLEYNKFQSPAALSNRSQYFDSPLNRSQQFDTPLSPQRGEATSLSIRSQRGDTSSQSNRSQTQTVQRLQSKDSTVASSLEKEQLIRLTEELQRVQQELDISKMENRGLYEECEELKQRLKDFKKHAKKELQTQQTQQAQQKEDKKRKTAVQIDISDGCQEELKKMALKLKQQETTISDLTNMLQEAEEEIESLNRQLTVSRSTADTPKSKLKSLQIQIQQQDEDLIFKQKNTIKELKTSIQRIRKDYDELQTTMRELNDEYVKVFQENQECRRKMTKYQQTQIAGARKFKL